MMTALALSAETTTALDLPLDRILHGDALAMLRTLPSASVDAIVSDPPAGIAFMGKTWDSFNTSHAGSQSPRNREFAERGGPTYFAQAGQDIASSRKARAAFIDFLTAIFTEAMRVLKPGGHALVWALPRTSHWTGTALEDAGFEVRDQCYHIFGSGFPKSLSLRTIGRPELGTALKPAVEVWWLCRKPLSEPSVAANVLRYGTGAVHVDACRVAHDEPIREMGAQTTGHAVYRQAGRYQATTELKSAGRWPPHLLLTHAPGCDETAGTCVDGCPVREMDAQSGIRTSGKMLPTHTNATRNTYGQNTRGGYVTMETYGDTGGAARYYPQFYYTPKASRRERNAGCEALPLRTAAELTGRAEGSAGLANPRASSRGSARQNTHPTVKSIALMRWLIRLITPPGGIVLDPFAGSGTTLVAAVEEGAHYIGIEREAEYVAIAAARVAHATRQSAPIATFPPHTPAPAPAPAKPATRKRQRANAVPNGQLSLFAEAV